MGVLNVLSMAYTQVLQHIESLGDGVIQTLSTDQVYQLQGEDNLALSVYNTNNHQTTWGVLGSAILALADYMSGQGNYGAAAFTIFDGQNEVGTGSLGMY